MINFCKIQHKSLIKLIEAVADKDTMDIIKNSKVVETHRNGKCVQKEWEWYNRLIVTPTEIYTVSFVRSYHMTAEKFEKMKKIVKLLSKKS